MHGMIVLFQICVLYDSKYSLTPFFLNKESPLYMITLLVADMEPQKAHPSGHMMLKLRHNDVDATSSRRIDVRTTSFDVMCLLGLLKQQ